MVTHSSTSRPVQCLCMAERTGCPVFTDLWSYVPINIQIATVSLVSLEVENERDLTGIGNDTSISESYIIIRGM